jgi:hypothetical protein
MLATKSLCKGENDAVGARMGGFHALRDHPEREFFDMRRRFFSACSLCQGAGDLCDLGDPSAIVFTVENNRELHASPDSCRYTLIVCPMLSAFYGTPLAGIVFGRGEASTSSGASRPIPA